MGTNINFLLRFAKQLKTTKNPTLENAYQVSFHEKMKTLMKLNFGLAYEL